MILKPTNRDARNAAILFLLFTILLALLDPGNLGSSDTERRYQTTRWLWSGAPSVKPDDEAAGTGIVGADGKLHYWYGVGQSLVMIPADLIASVALGRQDTMEDQNARYKLRRLIVSLLTFPVLAGATATSMYLLLRELGLLSGTAFVGTVIACLCTRFIDLSQIHQEAGQVLLLLTTYMLLLLRWFRRRSALLLLAAGSCAGVSVLIRLPTLAYFVIATLLLVTADCTETSKDTARSALKMALYLLPALAIFLLIERAYHYYRFREIFSTYLDIQIRQGLARGGFYVGGDGYAPPGWPWLTPFWDGLKSHFLSLQYGILYFDPILVPSVYILIRYGVLIGRAHINWKMVAAHATAWLVLMADAVFYAKYYEPGGMAHWGDRYVAVGAVMTTMLAGGLYAQIFRRLRSWERWLLNSVFALSLAVQISSLFFPTWLEIAQAASGNRGLGPWMRIKNISAFFLNWPFDFGTVKALDPKAAELNFMVTKIAGIAHLSPKAYATALALWMAAIVTVLVALFRITAREAETPQEREVVPGFETGAPI